MGAAYYIALERPIDGLDTSMDGKGLARHMEALDAAADELGVRQLSDFFSIDADMLADILGDGEEDPPATTLPSLEQFSAEEGLATLRALATHSAAQATGVAEDLRACERILRTAAQHGVGWHFEIDI